MSDIYSDNNTDDFMLTTYDNKFNPFEQFAAWYKEDLRLGHDCCGLLAEKANTSQMFSDKVNDKIIRDAMDEIVESNPVLYKKVTKADFV